MLNMRIVNSNGAAMEIAAINSNKINILNVWEPDRLNAETARQNVGNVDVRHVYLGTEEMLPMKRSAEADIIYVNIARKNYKATESSVPIVDKNVAGKSDGNGTLVMKNAFRMISMQEPEMFIIEYGLHSLHPVAMEAFTKIPRYYIQKIQMTSVSDCGMPIKRNRSFIVGTKKDYHRKTFTKRTPPRLTDILEKGLEYGELPQYAKNRLNRVTKAYPAVVIDPCMDWLTPPFTAHYAKDDSAILLQDGPIIRPFTVKEIARLNGYEDSFIFAGTPKEQIRQIGDSIGVGVADWVVSDIILDYFR